VQPGMMCRAEKDFYAARKSHLTNNAAICDRCFFFTFHPPTAT
jgi:hypothetical protein